MRSTSGKDAKAAKPGAKAAPAAQPAANANSKPVPTLSGSRSLLIGGWIALAVWILMLLALALHVLGVW